MENNGSPKNQNEEPYEIPMGIDEAGVRIAWKPLENPNSINLATSLTRNNLYSNIVGYCYEHPDYWNVFYGGTRAGGFRLDGKTHTVLGVYNWSRKELIDELHLHMTSALETSLATSVLTEGQTKPVLFAIQDIENLLWHLQEPEVKKLQEILTQGNQAGIHVYCGIDSVVESPSLNIIQALPDNDENLFITEENQGNTILTMTGKETPFQEYWSNYRFSPVSLIPQRLNPMYSLA